MRSARKVLLISLSFAAGLFFWLRPVEVQAQACSATISGGGGTFTTIQAAVNAAAVAATILVSGNCGENVVVPEGKDRITLDGQNTATSTISGPNLANPSVAVSGRGVTIRRFRITGAAEGVFVNEGGTATVDGNLIEAVGTSGVVVRRHSFAFIYNNTIRNNATHGIHISENSGARIGFRSSADASARPNTIQGNQNRGIVIEQSSSAIITSNTITNNGRHGIQVSQVSYADIANNVINNNGITTNGDGILVADNSGINLGSDSGSGFLDQFNTTTVNNGGFGLRCQRNSFADGRLGTLNGVSGPGVIFSPASTPGFSGGCISSLNP